MKEKASMKEKLYNMLNNQRTVSILFLVLGLLLVILPAGILHTILRIILIIAMVGTGAAHVIRQLVDKENPIEPVPGPGEEPTNPKPIYVSNLPDLYIGVLTIVLGIFLFTDWEVVVKVLPKILGGILLADCVWTLKSAIALKKGNIDFWKIQIISVVIFAALAIFMALYHFTIDGTLIFAGWVYIANGVVNLLFPYLAKKAVLAGPKPPREPGEKDENGRFHRKPATHGVVSGLEDDGVMPERPIGYTETPVSPDAAADMQFSADAAFKAETPFTEAAAADFPAQDVTGYSDPLKAPFEAEPEPSVIPSAEPSVVPSPEPSVESSVEPSADLSANEDPSIPRS